MRLLMLIVALLVSGAAAPAGPFEAAMAAAEQGNADAQDELGVMYH